METEKFIGPKKVVSLVKENIKTNGGNEIVTVLYNGGGKEIMPLNAYNILATEKATDYTELRNRKINDLVLKTLSILAEHDIKSGEVDYFNLMLGNEILNSFNRATNFLWSKDDKSFVPGVNVLLDKSLLEADIIIRNISKDVGK